MDREEVRKKAQAFATDSVASLREGWKALQSVSGLDPRAFKHEVQVLRNVTDGRCPDGCCGNEDRPDWRPTPAEWLVLAEDVSRSRRETRTSGPGARTGGRR